MKAATLALALFISAAPHAAAAPNRFGIEGGDAAEIISAGANTCYLYKHYAVLSTPLAASAGTELLVKPRRAGADKKSSCARAGAAPLPLDTSEASYFFGLAGRFLFIDSGTGPGPRGLDVYDLEKSTSVHSARYSEPIALRNGVLNYWTPANSPATPKNCPEMKAWAQNGLGAELEEQVTLYLKTLKTVKTGDTRCAPRQ